MGSAFFIGACLAICLREKIRTRDLLLLLLLVVLLFSAKVNLIALALLPFILLRPSDFDRRGGYGFMALGTLMLLAFEVGGWTLTAYPRVQSSMIDGADPVGQLGHILANPPQFLWILFSDLLSNGAEYLKAWIAGYGYDYWSVPLPTYLFFAAAVVASFFIRSTTDEPIKNTRLSLVVVFIASYLATASIFYVAFSPVAASAVSGIHGRHLLSTMAPLVLACVGLISPLRIHWSRWAPSSDCCSSWAVQLSLITLPVDRNSTSLACVINLSTRTGRPTKTCRSH